MDGTSCTERMIFSWTKLLMLIVFCKHPLCPVCPTCHSQHGKRVPFYRTESLLTFTSPKSFSSRASNPSFLWRWRLGWRATHSWSAPRPSEMRIWRHFRRLGSSLKNVSRRCSDKAVCLRNNSRTGAIGLESPRQQ